MELRQISKLEIPCCRCWKGIMKIYKEINPNHIILKCTWCLTEDDLSWNETTNELKLTKWGRK